MKTKLLLRIRVVVIVAVTMVFAGQTNGQETKELNKVQKSKDSPNVFVFQDDKNSDQIDVVKSDGNVFVVRKQDGDVQAKKDNQKIRWEFKTDGNKDKKQNRVVRFRELDGLPGQHIIVIQDQDDRSEKRVRRIQIGETSEQSKGMWFENDGKKYQLLLPDDQGNIRKIIRKEKPHSHDPDQDEHSHDSLSDHAHGDHQHQDGHLHEAHGEFHFEGAEEIHTMIEKALKEHGLSLSDDNVDVRVDKTDDGKMQIRVTAKKDGGNKGNVKKRVQMRVEKDDEHRELHALHDGSQIHKIEIKRDGDSKSEKRRVEKRIEVRRKTDRHADNEVEVEMTEERDPPRADRPKPPTPPKPPGRRIVDERRDDMRFGPKPNSLPPARGQGRARPSNFNERLDGMEKQLDSLERKLDMLIRNMESNRNRPGQRGARDRGGPDRRNEDPDANRADDNRRRSR